MPLYTIWTSNWGEGPKTILYNSCISHSCSNGILTTLSSLLSDQINISFPDRPSQTDKSYLCRHQGSSFCRSRWVGLGFWFTSLTHWGSELAGHWCCQIWHTCVHIHHSQKSTCIDTRVRLETLGPHQIVKKGVSQSCCHLVLLMCINNTIEHVCITSQ